MILTRMTRIPGIKAACAASLAIFMLCSGTVAAHAYWTAGTTVNSSAAAATFGMSAGNFAALDTTYLYSSTSSSPVIMKPIAVSNTGSIPLTYSLTVTNTNATLSSAVKLWLWTTGSSNCGTTPLNPAGTLAAPPAMPSGAASIGGNSAVTLCVATQLTGTLASPHGQSVVATFTITGRLGTSNWISSAASSTTQTVYSLAAPVPTCETSRQQAFKTYFSTLTWPAVPDATGYQVFVDTPGGPISSTPVLSLTSAQRTITVKVEDGDINISADSNIRIMSINSVYGQGQSVTVPIYYQPAFLVGILRPAATSCEP